MKPLDLQPKVPTDPDVAGCLPSMEGYLFFFFFFLVLFLMMNNMLHGIFRSKEDIIIVYQILGGTFFGGKIITLTTCIP